MTEIVLIILCVIASNRFRAAGEKGVGKYIGGVWGSWSGGVVLGAMLSAATESQVLMFLGIGAGYIAAFIVAGSAMSAGKKYLAYREKQKAEEERTTQAANQQLAAQINNLQTQISAMQDGGQKGQAE
jgi:mannitol-specific phosphotransferase system IIBC component